jgi:hypothetical protein
LTPASCAVGTSGSRRERLAAGDRQRLQHVALDLRQQRAEDVQPGLDLVAADGGHHVGRALEGHHLQVQPGGALEQLGRQVLRGADVGRADVELAGVLAPVVDQLAQRLEGAARLADDDQVERGQRRHGREGLERVVGQRLEQGLADGGAAGDQQQRVAVGRGRGHRLAGDHAAGAGLVVDDHRLAQGARHVLAHGARRDVGRAAGALGTTMRIGLAGKPAACAAPSGTAAAARKGSHGVAWMGAPEGSGSAWIGAGCGCRAVYRRATDRGAACLSWMGSNQGFHQEK